MKTYSIGRGDENDVTIRDHSVSRNHAELRVDDEGQFQLIDLNSTNGTFVRDGEEWVQVYQAYVAEDERIMFGSTATTVTALLARKPIEPGGTLTGAAAAGDEAPDSPAEREITEEDSPQEPAGQAASGRADNIKIDDPPPREGARSYEEYLQEKQDGEAPPPAAADAGAGRTRKGKAPAWLKWAAVGTAALLLAGAGAFAAFEFKDVVFAGGATKTAQSTNPAAPVKPVLKGPRDTWEVAIGGVGGDRVTSLQIAPDGGYLLAGYRNVNGKAVTKGKERRSGARGGAVGWLVRLDANGNKLWERIFGGAKDDRIDALLRTVDGGYIAVGATRSKGKGDWDFWVLRLDANANLRWEKVYGGSGADMARGVVALRDGGFAIAGTTESKSKDGGPRAWIIKIDANGKQIWDKVVGKNATRVNALGLTGEGGFVLAGSSARGKRNPDFWVARLNPSGKQLWRYTTGGRARDVAQAVLATHDGGFIVAGETASRGYGKGDAFLVKLNKRGKRKWARVYGGKAPDGALALTQDSKGYFVLTGFTESKGRGGRDLWLAKVSSKGGKQWERTHGGGGSESGVAILALAKGGLVVAGSTDSQGAGKEDAWVLKLDAKGFYEGGSAGPKATPGKPKPKKAEKAPVKKTAKKKTRKKRAKRKSKKKTN